MTRLLFIVLALLSACSPVYVPNVRNSPMFTKAGEFQTIVQIGNGLEAQSAFAVSEHVGLMSNFSYINRSTDEDETSYHRHRFFEAGVGYYSNRDESFFELFAGYGRGKGTSFDSFEFFGPQSSATTGKYERYFLQPAFGLNKDELNFSFAPRFTMVDFYHFSTELGQGPVHEEPKFFLEPAIIGRANFANNHLFAIFQAGVSLGLSDDIYFHRRTLQISAGLGLRLGAARQLVNRL